MSVWFRRVAGLNTETMRKIADNAGVSWSAESIVYRGHGIGYADGNPDDESVLQDAAESVLGYRPVVIDAPPEPEHSNVHVHLYSVGTGSKNDNILLTNVLFSIVFTRAEFSVVLLFRMSKRDYDSWR